MNDSKRSEHLCKHRKANKNTSSDEEKKGSKIIREELCTHTNTHTKLTCPIHPVIQLHYRKVSQQLKVWSSFRVSVSLLLLCLYPSYIFFSSPSSLFSTSYRCIPPSFSPPTSGRTSQTRCNGPVLVAAF